MNKSFDLHILYLTYLSGLSFQCQWDVFFQWQWLYYWVFKCYCDTKQLEVEVEIRRCRIQSLEVD